MTDAAPTSPWLQELPDPVTKIVWSSWVEIHPETATRLGIERGDIVEVKTADGTVKAPAYLYLGVRLDTIAIPLGQGHRSATPIAAWDPTHQDATRDIQWGYGRYARNVGVNPFDLMPGASDAAGGFVWTATKASLTKTGDSEVIPSTEGSARQHGRGIAQAISITDLLSGKAEGPTEVPLPGRCVARVPARHCARPSRPTRRVSSARRRRPIPARTSGCTIPRTRSAWPSGAGR